MTTRQKKKDMQNLITVREALSQVKKELKEVNADSRLTNKLVYSILGRHVKSVMARDSDAFRLSNIESLYQTLKCVEVIEAPAIDPCCGLRSRCVVFRTKERLPELLEDSQGPRIRLVAPVDMLPKMKGKDTSLQVISAVRYIQKLENPWAKWNPENYAIYHDGYLYFSHNYKLILVQGLYLHEVYSACEEDKCIRFLDKRIFAPSRQISEAIGKTIEEIAGIYKRLPEQVKVDKNDNTK